MATKLWGEGRYDDACSLMFRMRGTSWLLRRFESDDEDWMFELSTSVHLSFLQLLAMYIDRPETTQEAFEAGVKRLVKINSALRTDDIPTHAKGANTVLNVLDRLLLKHPDHRRLELLATNLRTNLTLVSAPSTPS